MKRWLAMAALVGLVGSSAWAQSLVGLRIDGPSLADENTVTFYRVLAEFDSGQEYEVTLSSYLWVSPEQYAEIGLFGDFATYEIPAVAVETIWAYYAFGADVETASLDVTIENIFNVLDVWPAPDSVLVTPPESIVITLSEAADDSTVNTSTCRLVRSVDGVFDNGDDEQIAPAGIVLSDPTHITVELTGIELVDDMYRIAFDGSLPGYALSYTAAEKHVVIVGRDAALEPSELTIEAWVLATALGGSDANIVHKFAGFSPGYDLRWQDAHIGFTSRTVTTVYYQTWSNYRSAADPLTNEYLIGQWHHVAMSYSSNTDLLTLFIDGEVIEQVTGPGGISHSGDMGIGNGAVPAQTSYAFDGVLDEVRIWNIVRGQPDILRDMHRALRGDEPGLAGYWKFDESQGQLAYDLTDNSNHGTLGLDDEPIGDSHDPQWVASTAPIYGISDLDGNVLDGEFSGSFPSGDGTAGGDFVYQFTIARIPGDFDEDGDVDLDDYDMFENCLSLSGPGVTPPFTECLDVFDFDADNDCDLADYAIFAANFTGPL